MGLTGSTNLQPRRVVITGIGVISPFGNTPEQLWEGLTGGQSAVRDLTSLPTTALPTRFGAEVLSFSGHIDDFGPLEGEKKKSIRKTLKVMCREALMGVAAGQRAIADAGLAEGKFDPERAGAIFGADYMITAPDDFSSGIQKCRGEDGKFQFTRWAEEGIPQLSPLWLLKYLPNMPAAHIGIYNDMRGPNNSITIREASANLAIGEAGQMIARGGADIIVTGATGTRVHPMKIVHSVTQEEVAGNGAAPASASRPFDLHRSGMVLGEGAGALVLEELSHAQARGAKIFGEFISTGSSSVASAHLVANRKQALINAMRAALRSAGMSPSEIGHIHAHGLASRSCDIEEAAAIHEVFGSAATTVPVTTAKGHFGNLGAGSGAVELIASLLAMQSGTLFPVLNYQSPDPECRLNIVKSAGVPAGKSVLNLSVTPQGQASVVICRAAE
jgi:3-oxoacyl-[acyl-carrier-protein] synthase II